MPSKSPDDSDDTRIAEIPSTSSQPSVPLQNQPPPSAPPASIHGMTGVISGGVSMGPSSGSEYTFVPSTSHQSSRRQQHGYSRAAASAPAPTGQSGSYQPPHPHSHAAQAMPSGYAPDYNSTRATPSPGYMNPAYGVPQYSSVPPQHPSQVGQQYPPRFQYANPLAPPVVQHYPSFSQAAYVHLGVGGDMYGGPAPMYSQQSYVPSPEIGPVPGPGHSPTAGMGVDPMNTIPGAYPYPPVSGGPSSNSPPGALGQPGQHIPPTGYPHRISPHGHPQSSPIPHQHSPHTAAYPQQYSNPPGNSHYALYGPPSFQGSYSVSPVHAQGYGQYPSPPMPPEDPSQQISPTVTQFPPPQPGGTWWYVPPGGGPPQAFPPGAPAGYEYQGPFTMSFGSQPQSQRAQPVHQPQPPQQSSTVVPDSPELPVTPAKATAGNAGRGAPAPRHPTQPRRGAAGRGIRGVTMGPRGRGATQLHQPRGGGPSGAGLAAGSPSGGSASHSQPTTSSDAPPPGTGVAAPSRPTFVTGLAAMRKGKEPVRQAFHPRPQAHGHEWVMWVGNIPDHATQNEVWNFFRNPHAVAYYMAMKSKNPDDPPEWPALGSQPVQPAGSSADAPPLDGPADGGVSSVFVIKSSNCAFVNFDTEEALKRAMRVFNGVPLRPYDSECPPLVCRIRRKDDDLRTGVAAQRGWGLHTNWIRLQAEAMKKAGLVPEAVGGSKKAKGKEKESVAEGGAEAGSEIAEAGSADLETDAGSSPQVVVPPHLRSHEDPPTSPSTHLGPSSNSDPSPPVKLDYGPRGGVGRGRPMPPLHHSSSASSGSYASTNSSFLARYFPKRYFILKSLSEYDLNLSVDRGVWATQPHNEPILDQAFRTSKEVWLIFGANKSGEFFGYARMMSGVSRGERKVPWAGRSESNSSRSGESPGLNRQRSSYSVIVEESADNNAREHEGPHSPLAGKSQEFFGTMAPLATSPSPLTPGEASGMPSPSVHLPRRGKPIQKQQLTDAQDAEIRSAPAELGPPHKKVTKPDQPGQPEPATIGSPPHSGEQAEPRLDPHAPIRAARRPDLLDVDKVVTEEDIRKRAEVEGSSLSKAIESERAGGPGGSNQPSDQWGIPFKILWVKMERLPFVRVKHLRNPWNYDREVKISRDGIELEPTVGEALLREWDKLEAEREAFQRVLQAQWVQRDGQWYQADGRLAPSSGELSSTIGNTRASTARGADSRSP
ncbi:hypothetical protein FRB90_005107 [Tulasnella sp. 427]|nr:hypothetical protein FRB90_005107 [Tulasnella sp. 427]